MDQSIHDRNEATHGWIKLALQPALFLVVGLVLIVGLGVAQKLEFISAGGGGNRASAGGEAVRYICPMMCTPPQAEPGRCPVCAMELVPATTASNSGDSRSIQIDPAARRVANIRTATVKSTPMTRSIRAIGELHYDEGSLKTISAYVDGRLDRLYADYTGVVVKKGDHLALVYSPQLYSGQVELLVAKRAQADESSDRSLYELAKKRLIEMGMTEPQIEQLEQAGEANSRVPLCAPMSGTVIEKLTTEGEYIKEGQAICKLADLSTVWLMLELFPEDAAAIRYGQKVEAEIQSLPGRKIAGRVAVVAPGVNAKTRTVSVRVVIPNLDGQLRPGDYAKATMRVPVVDPNLPADIYDPELAGKWISPRHPHVVESSPGKCRICGIELVPATQFGFSSEPNVMADVLVIPRDAVLTAGDNSVVYVEAEPGRFVFRQVVLGPSSGDRVVVISGVEKDEQVATRGNFLIDSQMQLVGNPSLIDPTKAATTIELEMEEIDLPESDSSLLVFTKADELPPVIEVDDGDDAAKIAAALGKLSAADRKLAEQQKICPVANMQLGSMGTPIKVDVNGTPVFICCEGCRSSLLEKPVKYLAKLPKGTLK